MEMDIAWQEWLGLMIRWLHVVAGIAWIGTSFYFIWLDQSLRRPVSYTHLTLPPSDLV